MTTATALTDAAYPVAAPVPHPVLVLVRPRPRLVRRTVLVHATKRVLDVLVASIALLVSLPVLVLSVVAISLTSRGAPIFVQERVGKDGRHFRFYKLRTMVAGNDETVQIEWAAQWVHGGGFNGLYKLVNDHRVTRVGRFLRRYSIDELPQMWNVIRGDMSLVGPRPALPHEVAMYDDVARRRLEVKPGVTGLWQVSGRSELSFPEMIALDLHYATWWSLRSDLRILARTPVAAISARGAA
ncbi:MAG TPA: sugar transferase [Mycobacteriales bacterium]|nr:sugar transferase [Mycobacteriales bacterium]